MPLPFFFLLLLVDLLLLLLLLLLPPPRRHRLLLRLRLEDWSWEDLRHPPPLDELIISIGVDTRLSIVDVNMADTVGVDTVDTAGFGFGIRSCFLVLVALLLRLLWGVFDRLLLSALPPNQSK